MMCHYATVIVICFTIFIDMQCNVMNLEIRGRCKLKTKSDSPLALSFVR